MTINQIQENVMNQQKKKTHTNKNTTSTLNLFASFDLTSAPRQTNKRNQGRLSERVMLTSGRLDTASAFLYTLSIFSIRICI